MNNPTTLGTCPRQAVLRDRRKKRDGWIRFEEHFSISHPQFLEHITAAFPALTRTELQICAMIRNLLSSKQIAEQLCIDERTVDNHRSSIRRKILVTHDENLHTVLSRY